jgi:hypothetical protein
MTSDFYLGTSDLSPRGNIQPPLFERSCFTGSFKFLSIVRHFDIVFTAQYLLFIPLADQELDKFTEGKMIWGFSQQAENTIEFSA